MHILLTAIALATAFAAQAQSTIKAGGADAERIVITGSGTEQRLFDTPYAVGTVDAATLRAAGPMVNLSEALARVPGLVVANRGNYAQDLQISSRGFGARTSFGVRGLRLYADGIPASGPDGQGSVSNFDLAGAARIEVLRGPFSALYGNSSGGVIALVSTAPTERSAGLDLDVGSQGLVQWRATVAAPLAGGFSVRASASRFDTDGLRPQSAATRQLGNVRLGWEDERNRVVVVLNSINQPAQDALGLTRAQFAADPGQTAPQATQFDTRKSTAQTQAGASWLHRYAAGPLRSAQLAAYAGQRSVTQWQSIPPATQAPARHPGGVIDFDRGYDGVDARLQWAGSGWRLTTGLAADRQQEDRRGFENFTGSGVAQVRGVTGRLRRDEDNRVQSRDVYAQGEIDMAAQLSASAGLRNGRIDIRSSDRFLSNGDDSGRLRFGYTTPVAALRWQPADDLSVYASFGRGFESPTLNELAYRPDGNPGFNTALTPQRNRQWELGVKWRADGGRASVDAALFQATTQDEIGVQTNSGGRSTFANVGRTKRQGFEIDARWQPGTRWRAALALTWLDATYTDGFLSCAGVPCTAPTVPVAAGNRIAGTVPKSAFAELAWRLAAATELGLEARAQGRIAVNDLNGDFAAGHGLLALRLQHRLPLGPGRLELLVRLDNLADRRVAGSVIVNEGNQRFFEPAPGRTALLSARYALTW